MFGKGAKVTDKKTRYQKLDQEHLTGENAAKREQKDTVEELRKRRL